MIDLVLPAAFWPLAGRLALLSVAGALGILVIKVLHHIRTPSRHRDADASLWPRCGTWVVLTFVFLLANGLGSVALGFLLAVVALQAMREIGHALTCAGFPVDAHGMAACGFFLVVAAGLFGDRYGMAILLAGVAASGVLALRPSAGGGSVAARGAIAVLALSAIVTPLAFLVLMRWQENGFGLVAWVLSVVWIGDIAAMFGGLIVGRRLLMPAVSPGKTVEGTLIGFLGGLAGAALVRFALPETDAWLYYGYSLLLAVAGLGGDLAASALKRRAGLKDFGSVLPGHGGIMDRFDSLLIAVPLAAILGPQILGLSAP